MTCSMDNCTAPLCVIVAEFAKTPHATSLLHHGNGYLGDPIHGTGPGARGDSKSGRDSTVT